MAGLVESRNNGMGENRKRPQYTHHEPAERGRTEDVGDHPAKSLSMPKDAAMGYFPLSHEPDVPPSRGTSSDWGENGRRHHSPGHPFTGERFDIPGCIAHCE